MTRIYRLPLIVAACIACLLLLGPVASSSLAKDTGKASDKTETKKPDTKKADSEVIVGRLTYNKGKTAVCFADQFLSTYAFETGQNVRKSFAQVELDSDKLFDLPFVVFSGQEGFTLSKKEKANLKKYIDRGGFVLASAGCSNAAWAASFEKVIAELYGKNALTKLDTKHAMFNTVYTIKQINVPRRGTRHPVYGLVTNKQLRLLYSPLGLNDTGNAGGDCCCCGGSEIRNARFINVNALGYALSR